jgi:hypothetical protein
MKPTLVLHLVHGTWPEGGWVPHRIASLLGRHDKAEWIHSESSFRRDLETHLAPVARVIVDDEFSWRGRNSWRERHAAAAQLAERLTRIESGPDPSAMHMVIAHSHGGNVALWAIHSLPREQRERILGLVCMATPFLHAERGAARGAIADWGLAAVLLTIGMASILAFALFFVMFAQNGWTLTRSAGALFGPPRASSYIALAVVAVVSILLSRWLRTRQQYLITPAPPTDGEGPPILALRAHGDEASFAIGAGEVLGFVSSLPATLLRAAARAAFGGASAAVAARVRALTPWRLAVGAIVYLALAVTLAGVGDLVETRAVYVSYVSGIGRGMLLLTALWFVANVSYSLSHMIHAIVYGPEALAAGGNWRLRAEGAPTGIGSTLIVLDVPFESRIARHSLPMMPQTAERVAEWCAATVRRAVSLSLS